MRRLFLILGLALCTIVTARAQSFTGHLQEKKPGQGNVSVTQSKEIDELVNHTDVSAQKKEPIAGNTGSQTRNGGNSTSTTTANGAKASTSASTQKTTTTPQHNESNKPGREQSPTNHSSASQSSRPSTNNGEKDEPVIDTHKKVMRRSYKVNGYRVQVFAGGNSRTDKEKAQQAGNAVKRALPDQPVYVHFYSPRWICRVGNYRSYEEANNVLRQVQKLGYKQACIVSGKITVAY